MFASAQILLKPILHRYFLELSQRRVFVGRELEAQNGQANNALHVRGRAIWGRFYSPHPSRCILQKVPCFESRVLDTKSVKQCFLRVIVMLFFVRFTTQFQLSFCLFTIEECSLFSSSTLRAHCVAAVCLSRVIDTLPLFSPHRRFRAASTHQWSCVRGCVSANTAVWTKEDEERAKGVRWLWNTRAQEKHLGCGRFFADQTLCQVKEKKKEKKEDGHGETEPCRQS